MDIKPGTRFRCDTCGTELILMKVAAPELTCCGKPLALIAAGRPAAQPGDR